MILLPSQDYKAKPREQKCDELGWWDSFRHCSGIELLLLTRLGKESLAVQGKAMKWKIYIYEGKKLCYRLAHKHRDVKLLNICSCFALSK